VPQTVEVGSVDEVDALVDGGADRPGRDVVVGAGPGEPRHGTASQRDGGDHRTSRAERARRDRTGVVTHAAQRASLTKRRSELAVLAALRSTAPAAQDVDLVP